MGCGEKSETAPLGERRGETTGDFDGDGHEDIFILYNPVGPVEPVLDEEPGAFYDDGPYRIRIEFGAGGASDEEFGDWANRVLGAVDVNGDGRDEGVVDLGGNTAFNAEFVTVVGCRATRVTGADGVFLDFGYYAHSTGAPGSVGTHCIDRDGDGHFDEVVSVYSEPIGFPDKNGDGVTTSMDFWASAPEEIDHYRWERETWVLREGTMQLTAQSAGTYERDEGQLELSNELVCGEVRA